MTRNRSDSALLALLELAYAGEELLISESEHDRLIELASDDDRFNRCGTIWNPARVGLRDALILFYKEPK